MAAEPITLHMDEAPAPIFKTASPEVQRKLEALVFTNSTPDQAFGYALKHGEVLVALPLLQGLQQVLAHSKFDRYVTHAERAQLTARRERI
ncbi:MAG: hypothetical protein ACLQUY_25380 [Ktedonobacterales bacterium]